MLGYKAFNKNLRCMNFQYKIGETYSIEETPIPCKRGFHFCKSIADTYRYYYMNSNTRICKVEAIGDIETDDNIKFCTNKIKIIEEITEEWERKGNTNPTSIGYCNTGYYNSGNRNTGNCNSGECNSGYFNSGYCNIGYYNSGNYNRGDENTGNWNIGDYNTGFRNTGDHNTGDWNTGNYSTGCFNTETETIRMFNKPTNLTYNDWLCMNARYILEDIPPTTEWIDESFMTEEEKEKYPSYNIIGGYFKPSEESAQEYWNELEEEDKREILNLPNFDKDIFKKCTGIDVDM